MLPVEDNKTAGTQGSKSGLHCGAFATTQNTGLRRDGFAYKVELCDPMGVRRGFVIGFGFTFDTAKLNMDLICLYLLIASTPQQKKY